jgi:preprotein translocase subunit YajC
VLLLIGGVYFVIVRPDRRTADRIEREEVLR